MISDADDFSAIVDIDGLVEVPAFGFVDQRVEIAKAIFLIPDECVVVLGSRAVFADDDVTVVEGERLAGKFRGEVDGSEFTVLAQKNLVGRERLDQDVACIVDA